MSAFCEFIMFILNSSLRIFASKTSVDNWILQVSHLTSGEQPICWYFHMKLVSYHFLFYLSFTHDSAQTFCLLIFIHLVMCYKYKMYMYLLCTIVICYGLWESWILKESFCLIWITYAIQLRYVHYKYESCSWWGVLNTTVCDQVCQWLATGRYWIVFFGYSDFLHQ